MILSLRSSRKTLLYRSWNPFLSKEPIFFIDCKGSQLDCYKRLMAPSLKMMSVNQQERADQVAIEVFSKTSSIVIISTAGQKEYWPSILGFEPVVR